MRETSTFSTDNETIATGIKANFGFDSLISPFKVVISASISRVGFPIHDSSFLDIECKSKSPYTYTILSITLKPTAINRSLDEIMHARPSSNHSTTFTSNDRSANFLCVCQFQSPFTSFLV